MKREGRQHGMIRTQMILPNNKHYTQFQQFQAPHHHQAKVSGKPTNHSKSTSKFGKPRYGGNNNGSKDKGKGQQKVKSFDVGLNHRLVSWRVVDDKGYHGLNYVGASASDVLGHLSNYYYHNYEEDDDEDDGVDEHEFYHDSDDSFGLSDELVIGSCSVAVVEEDEDDDDGIVDKGKEIDIDDMGICDEDEEDDDDMGFCDVGFVIQQLDEDWCLVGELGGD